MTPVHFQLPPMRLERWRKYTVFALLAAGMLAPPILGPIRLNMFIPHADNEMLSRYQYQDTLPAHRGGIVDAIGRPLALNADVYNVRADTLVLMREEGRRVAEKLPDLVDILEIDEQILRKKLSSGGRFVLLRRALPPSRAQDLRDLKLRGLRVEYDSKRYYPQKNTAATLLGYTNYEDVGRTGIEFVRHRHLAGKGGQDRGLRARDGTRLIRTDWSPPQDGRTITLSIDSRLQFYAYQALKQALHHHHAAAGAAVIMDAHSGKILAAASLPSFNPNNIRGGNEKNRAITDAVEPGSLAKPFIVAAALYKNETHAEEIFPTAKPHRIGGKVVKDEHIREDLSLPGIIQKSSNVGAAMLAWRVGAEHVWRLYQQLGFGGGKVLHLPGETGGHLRHYEDWRPQDFTTHAYGYGFAVSLLQLLRGYSVFATDGLLVEPQIENGGIPKQRHRVLPAAVARQVRHFMEGVTRPGGTATRAAIAGYRVAGKTGTAIKHGPNGYEAGKYRAFFVGIAPVSKPRYVVAVMIDEPSQNGYTGGAAAAPVFEKIMRRALFLNGIVPDDVDGDLSWSGEERRI